MAVIDELHRRAGRPLVMGIVNVTPDSFYPESRAPQQEGAVEHARTLVAQGADLLDIGGESTRPGAAPVAPEAERDRVVPVIEALTAELDVPISVDTRRASVARAALEAGAVIVNDVSAGCHDEGMLEVVADANADVVLMHMQGTPETMQQDPTYKDVVTEVEAFLAERTQAAQAAGIPTEAITVDPGLGFGKTLAHNLALIGATERLAGLGHPLLIGASRKSMFKHLLGREVEARLPGSLAVAAYTAAAGASVLRVHDVRATRDVVDTLQAIEEASR